MQLVIVKSHKVEGIRQLVCNVLDDCTVVGTATINLTLDGEKLADEPSIDLTWGYSLQKGECGSCFPHLILTRIGEANLFECDNCHKRGTLEQLQEQTCNYMPKPCKFCKSTPICEPDCSGIAAILGDTTAKESTQKETCYYCGKEFPLKELAPYGPNKEFICYTCGMKDEHRKVTEKQFAEWLDKPVTVIK